MTDRPKSDIALKTRIATSSETTITIRGHDLVDDMIGKVGFMDFMYFHVTQRFPTPSEVRVLDMCLVTLAEHGLNPSTLITRLMADSVPGQLQVAVAAGLLAAGDVFIGTLEGCGTILHEAAAVEGDPRPHLRAVVAAHRAEGRKLPGFGHPQHRPDDPRTPKLFEAARAEGVSGRFIDLVTMLGEELDAAMGRHQTINATGAIAALLLEIGLPPDMFRGLAVVSRCVGLLGHVQEERTEPMARKLWRLADEHTHYEA